jgi:hypothetical protein
MLSVVLDLPDNLEVLARCLSMMSTYLPVGDLEVIVPWEGQPREILPVMKAFSSRLFWKVVICPAGKGGSLAAYPHAKFDNPVVMSHRVLVGADTLKTLEANPGRALVYLANDFPLQWDPYSFWTPPGFYESCLEHPYQTPQVQVVETPLCANGDNWSDAIVLLLPGTTFRFGEILTVGDFSVISSLDKPCFPPNEDRL